MSSILEGELADEVAEALGVARIPTVVTIRVTIPGGGPSYDPEPPTFAYHPCQGWPESYDDDQVDGTRIASSDLKIMVLTPSIDIEPTTSHSVIANGLVYSILAVKRDASGALYEIQARR
jgi:hypothetical protein